jgi:hypothetical protein
MTDTLLINKNHLLNGSLYSLTLLMYINVHVISIALNTFIYFHWSFKLYFMVFLWFLRLFQRVISGAAADDDGGFY